MVVVLLANKQFIIASVELLEEKLKPPTIDALVAAGKDQKFTNFSPGELGARSVEALDIAYRSAASGKLEHRL